MSDPLDPSALLSTLPTLLPDDKVLKSPNDGLAALFHTVMIALGFRLVALDESSPAQEIPSGGLPEEWNRLGPDSYAFRYKHDQSSLIFYLKVIKMGKKAIVHGIALETDKTNSLEILVSDYFSPSFFPHTAISPSAPLVQGFISSARVKDLVGLYKLNILQKLVPGLRKDGYQDDSESANSQGAGGNSRQPPPPQPRSPYGVPAGDPDHNNPLRIPNVGRSDLDPFPGHNPFSPPPLFGGIGGGDGMYVGPNHPIFRDRFAPGGVGGPTQGPWGGDGYLPPMGAPPGARFDPIFPGGRGGPPGGLPGSGRRPFGGPARGGGAAGPDNDEFLPPGFDDMYS